VIAAAELTSSCYGHHQWSDDANSRPSSSVHAMNDREIPGCAGVCCCCCCWDEATEAAGFAVETLHVTSTATCCCIEAVIRSDRVRGHLSYSDSSQIGFLMVGHFAGGAQSS
jgi:hypothetical protein